MDPWKLEVRPSAPESAFSVWLATPAMNICDGEQVYTVKHLLFAWPYFREIITHDLFTGL